MDIVKKLFGPLYKAYIILRERFFLIPPPETHPPQPSSIMGEGMGGDDILQEDQLVEKHQFQPSQVYTSGEGEVLAEERTVTVHPPPPVSGTGQALTPPTPSASIGTGRGRKTCPRVNGETYPPPVPLTKEDREAVLPEGEKGGGWKPGGGAELLQRTGDFEIPPSLEGQHISLCETLDRVLNTGVVVHGDITVSVANIDLIYIGLRALLTSVETARQSGINPLSQYPNPNESEESLNGNLRF